MNVEYLRNGGWVGDENNCFTFEVSQNPRDFDSYRLDATDLDWAGGREHYLGNWRVYPYGNNNQLPKEIRDVIQKNYIAPGLLKKKTQWLWGKGPKLYQEGYDEQGKLIREWQDHEEIRDWLEGWEHEDYLQKCCVDFNYIDGVWSKIVQSKVGRIRQPKISKLEFIPVSRARLAERMESVSRKPTHGIVTDWDFNIINAILNYHAYPLYDHRNPFAAKHSIYYSNMYSFCSEYYTVPDIYGALEWLRRSTAIPIILGAMSRNAANIKYHVISPQKFWDDKKVEMEKQATAKGKKFKESDFKKWKDDFLRGVAKVLSNVENTGKFWHTTKSFEVEGTNIIEHGWEIKELPNNIKNFIDGQIAISKRADHAVSGSVGLGSVLGNVSESGNRNSGSDRIYAMQDYLQTGIDLPEMFVMKAINYAIRANWPGTRLKLGFYHDTPKKEEEKTPEDRIINTGR